MVYGAILMKRALASLSLAALLSAFACGGDSSDPAGAAKTACRSRVTIFCRCTNGDGGWQTCKEDGSGFGDCGPCDGPSTGNGGATGAATTGCGNGRVDPGEACDDGNADDSDGCTSGCREAFCGDGLVRAEVEACDDGNHKDDDACSNTCQLQTALSSACPGITLAPTPDVKLQKKGDLADAKAATTGTCAGAGREAIYAFKSPANGQASVGVSTTTATADLVVYVREADCAAGKELKCSNFGAPGASEATFFAAKKDATYYVFVDTVADAAASYSVELVISPDVKCEGEGTVCDTGALGICALGKLACAGGKLSCVQTFTKAAKDECGDGLDNDCNGTIDEGCPCAHDTCTGGKPLGPTCDACVTKICANDKFCCAEEWDPLCVAAVATECKSAACNVACAHSLCKAGEALKGECDKPSTCVAAICATDPFCCAKTWDDQCIEKVSSICQLACP